MAAGGGAAGRSSPGRPAAYRLYRIHLEIKSGKCPNTRELAQALEVSSRTIERDIAYLRDMFQAPLHFDPKRRGYIYTEPSFEIPPLELQEGEVAALAVAARLLAQDLQTPIAPVAERALQRLIALLPGKVMIAPNQLEAALSFAPNTGAAAAELVRERFDQLMTAILNEKTVDSVYWSASRQEDTRRRIDPYTLYFADSAWYVIGYCRLREQVRIFALQRFKEMTVTNESFQRPEEFSAKEFMGQAWQAWRGPTQEIELWFSPAMAPLVAERRWHPSQSLTPQDDGSLLMRLQVDGIEEVMGWILRWGPECEVVGPPGLRREVAARIAAMADRYREFSG